MRLALLCATRRGLACYEALRRLCPDDAIEVCVSPELAGEPPYIADVERAAGGVRVVTRLDAWDSPVDLMLLVHWRYVLPRAVYERAARGTFVLHDSLLPRYRGFSPTVWAIANGERECGATLLHCAPEVDTGDIVDQERVPIGELDTIAELFERVTAAYVRLLERQLPALRRGDAPRRPQDAAQATYAPRRRPEDNRIDWARPHRDVWNLVRAVTRPYAGAFTHARGERLVVWRAAPDGAPRSGRPGTVVETLGGGRARVLCGDGSLIIETAAALEPGMQLG